MASSSNSNVSPGNPYPRTFSGVVDDFPRNFPKWNASKAQVAEWLRNTKVPTFDSSTPIPYDWSQRCDLNSNTINFLAWPLLMESLEATGLDAVSAQWVGERIIFARGLSAGTTAYLQQNLPLETPDLIRSMRTQICNDLRAEIRKEIDVPSLRDTIIDEFKTELEQKIQLEFTKEEVMDIFKTSITNHVRDQGMALFTDDQIKQLAQNVKVAIKNEVKEVVKLKFRGSIISGMKYEIMEEIKNELVYDPNKAGTDKEFQELDPNAHENDEETDPDVLEYGRHPKRPRQD